MSVDANMVRAVQKELYAVLYRSGYGASPQWMRALAQEVTEAGERSQSTSNFEYWVQLLFERSHWLPIYAPAREFQTFDHALSSAADAIRQVERVVVEGVRILRNKKGAPRSPGWFGRRGPERWGTFITAPIDEAAPYSYVRVTNGIGDGAETPPEEAIAWVVGTGYYGTYSVDVPAHINVVGQTLTSLGLKTGYLVTHHQGIHEFGPVAISYCSIAARAHGEC